MCLRMCVWKRDTHTHRSIYSSYSQQLEWSINLANAHMHKCEYKYMYTYLYAYLYAYTEVWIFRENKLVFLELSIACLPGPYSSGILPARWSSTKLHDDAKDQGEETKWRQFPPWTNLELIEKFFKVVANLRYLRKQMISTAWYIPSSATNITHHKHTNLPFTQVDPRILQVPRMMSVWVMFGKKTYTFGRSDHNM